MELAQALHEWADIFGADLVMNLPFRPLHKILFRALDSPNEGGVGGRGDIDQTLSSTVETDPVALSVIATLETKKHIWGSANEVPISSYHMLHST